ncbi:MAG: hypothetical protein KDI90_03940 [Alphaproteobacteria bacterium]|nr:hypothetical protein [Alphaproteobacteria bacterium]MCB9975917.1 hypothetical protein [Rhodospirillales bacterium]
MKDNRLKSFSGAGLVLLSLMIFFTLLPLEAHAEEPEKVVIGVHVNDIQEIDLRTHSYRLDFYLWFRWNNPEINPAESIEFMNSFEPEDHVRTLIYDEPQKMPDGSLYMVLRERGKFSAKFPLNDFPFDKQKLTILLEDSVSDEKGLIYVADPATEVPISINKDIYIPGFLIGVPVLEIGKFFYDTNFGDLNYKGGSNYSRAKFIIPLSRPEISMAVKIFMPIVLILLCTALVYFVHPVYIEGRLGVVITALLTLVALQLTSTSALPEVDYLLLTDKVYLLSYIFIIVTLAQIVLTSSRVKQESYEKVIKRDILVLFVSTAMMMGGMALILMRAI